MTNISVGQLIVLLLIIILLFGDISKLINTITKLSKKIRIKKKT